MRIAKLKKIVTEIRSGGAAYDWDNLAKDHQKPPDGAWTAWLILGGRGAGKTRAGAEWIRSVAESASDAKKTIALVSETYGDAREVMIEGQSGLKHIGHPNHRPSYEASRRRLVWPNGSVGYCFSAEDPDGLRGFQFHAAWSDELCKWRYPEETWSNLQLALRLGDYPRQVVTTTPRPMALLKRLMVAETTRRSTGTTYDNADNLSAAFMSEIAAAFEGSAIGRQELLGEMVEDVAGALWSWSMIEAAQLSVKPDFVDHLDRIVVAVDPPATAGPDADECGIIVAGSMTGDGQLDPGRGFVITDRSRGGLSPIEWAQRAVNAYHEFHADRIIVEVNQGGDMVRSIVAQVDPSVPVREVRATRGKYLRAEPVAALYEQGRVRHLARLPDLEDQMAHFTGTGGKSPDRLDALVWALTELMLVKKSGAPSIRAAM